MEKELRPVDVSDKPELLRLAEEVAASGVGLLLQKDDVELATVLPARGQANHQLTNEELAEFWSSAGSWPDVDVDEFMKHVYEGRQSSTPRVDL